MPSADPKPSKRRLDSVLVARGLAKTQSIARSMVLDGHVFSGGEPLLKPGLRVDPTRHFEIQSDTDRWLGRGGIKLAHGLAHFGIDPSGAIALDIGASTGGFTHVLVTGGAARVYAVDVGAGQMAEELRQNPRVIVLERVNARVLSRDEIPDPVSLIVCDASFIGLELVLANPLALARPGAHVVALIKPQFEVGPQRVGKGGIVRDPALHNEVCGRIQTWLADQGWEVLGVTQSPIPGAKGNQEFLIAARLGLPSRPGPGVAASGRRARRPPLPHQRGPRGCPHMDRGAPS